MKVRMLLVYMFLLMQFSKGSAQLLKASYDSLHNLLAYFYQNTGNAVFKQNLKSAQALLSENMITDSLARRLINTENILINLLIDSALLNRYPFNNTQLISLGSHVAEICSLLPHKEPYYASAVNNLGILYIKRFPKQPADDINASGLFKTAFEIRKKLRDENNPDYAESLFWNGIMHWGTGETEEAHAAMLKALAIMKKTTGEENLNYCNYVSHFAQLCKEMKKYDTSVLLHEQEIKIREKLWGNHHSNYALYLYYTGEMMRYLWQYQKAFTYYQQALKITKETVGEENIQYAYCLEGVAGYYYATAQYEKAIPLYLQSLGIKEKLYGKDYYDNGVTLHNIAITYARMGKFERAIPYLQETLTIQKNASAIPRYYAYELTWQALLYQSIGNFDKALSYYQQALKIPDYKEDKQRYAGTLNNIAELYEKLHDNKKAFSCLEEAASIIKKVKGEQSLDHAAILQSLATLYEKTGRYDSAFIACNESLGIRKRILGEENPKCASSLLQLGKLYMQTGMLDAAQPCILQALSIQKEMLGEEHPDYINGLNNLALLKAAQENNNEAAKIFIQANQSALSYITRTYTALSEQKKIAFENDQYYQFSYLPSLFLSRRINSPGIYQQLYANELALKAMVLNDQQSLLNSIRNSGDSSAIALYNEWRINKIIVGKQQLLPNDQRLPHFDSLKEATNQIEQKLSISSVAFRKQRQTFSAKDISEKLHRGEAAIEFIKFQYYNKKWTDTIVYAALIVLPDDSIPKFVSLFEEKQLAGFLNYFTNSENAINRFFSAKFNGKSSLPFRGDSLYQLIWKPLEKELEGIHTIYYAPAGLLHRISFKALPYDKTNRRLIDKYNLIQLLSTRSVGTPSSTEEKPSGMQLWANIQYTIPYNTNAFTNSAYIRGATKNGDSINTPNATRHFTWDTTVTALKWPPLPGTKLEMNSIKNIFIQSGLNVVTVTDTGASEKNFKAFDGRSPAVLHIATHGFFWPIKKTLNNVFVIQQDPMFRSGLILAGTNNPNIKNNIAYDNEDGILTAYEIAQMDLSNSKIVVLSACETALGDLENNEGVIGLQRAFKLAGVKQIIISLWRVPDTQTAELMCRFYTNWLKGQPVHKALSSAQLFMKTKYLPYDWAGFVLVE